MAAKIHFYFDFLSPYAYLAHHKLPELAARHGYAIAYCPVDLDQLKRAAGNTGPSTREMPIKHRHLRLDLQRWADCYGVPFKPPAGYGSQRLTGGAFYAIDRGVAAEYVKAAWQLVWGEGGAMNDDALLAAVASRMTWNAADFLSFVASDATRDRLGTMTRVASGCGVFGVPTMVVGEHMWWGNDRLHFLENHLTEIAK